MPSHAAILKIGKQKIHENKNEGSEILQEINKNYQQQNEQPTLLTEQAQHEK